MTKTTSFDNAVILSAQGKYFVLSRERTEDGLLGQLYFCLHTCLRKTTSDFFTVVLTTITDFGSGGIRAHYESSLARSPFVTPPMKVTV